MGVGNSPLDAIGDQLVEAEQSVVVHQVSSVGDADLVAKVNQGLKCFRILLHVPLEGVRHP
eukprot:8352939-Pyramimonas_sp.AAC.1